MSEEERPKELTQKQKFIIDLIIMIAVGFLVILPFTIYAYHFFI